MNILDFHKFINEKVIIPVVDVLIDDNGDIHSGEFNYNQMKGSIVLKKNKSGVNEIVGIVGQDNNSYPAGIDKNGQLVSVKFDDSNVALNSRGERLRIPEYVIDRYPTMRRFWRIKDSNNNSISYSDLVPILPTGWVNVKVDMEVLKRVKRYSKGIGTNNRGFESFISKLEDLSRMSGDGLLKRNRKRETIQKEMSVIILLHYINEIKNFFTPGSSGFLFESFIAGMIPNAKVVDDNSDVDVTASGQNYQIKLYNNLSSTIPVTTSDNVNHYITCIKNPTSIDIYIMDNIENSNNNYKKYLIKNGFSLHKIVTSKSLPKYTLELTNLELKISKIAEGLKESLDGLYSQLSQFQYNVETIITGVDKNGDIIGEDEFSQHSLGAVGNIREMEIYLKKLVGTIKRDSSI